ncbi:hypothetical protein ABE137_11155 [Brevibacillus laterosporus]|uniref:hypothetical protein n=1 Tax=Brevibacillus laterosporus TaxID=1465 RepID=UPI003D25D5BA
MGQTELEVEQKSCFIITPIGDDNSEIRRAIDGLIDAVIIPTLESLDFDKNKITVAHRMPNPGSINKQIINHILEDDLAVVNLTNLNPNVMYELAIRHGARKPTVILCEHGTKLPFDIVDERTIFYTNDMKGTIELKAKFEEMASAALQDEKPDNPIYRVIVDKVLLKDETISDFNKILLQRMERLEEVVIKSVSNFPQTKTEREDFSIYQFEIDLIANKEMKRIDILDFFHSLRIRSRVVHTSEFIKPGEITKVRLEVISKANSIQKIKEYLYKLRNDDFEVVGVH